MDTQQLAAPDPQVWLAQFGGPVEDEDRRALAKIGVQVLFPGADMNFYVRATAADLRRASADFAPAILGWARLEAGDKIIAADSMESFGVRVTLYPGAGAGTVLSKARELEALQRGSGQDWMEFAPVKPVGALALARALAETDDVYCVEPGWPRRINHNEEAAAASNVTPLLSAPFNLSGFGVTVMVRDEGRIFAHPDLDTRLQFASDVSSLQPVQHATHVAGTIGGSGKSIPGAGARGMATRCGMVSYDFNGDDVAEPLEAKTVFGAILSNHSYGFATGWSAGTFTDNQATFGQYATFARNWDSLVKSQNLIMVKSAGNERDGNGPGHPHNGVQAGDMDFYDTVDQTSTSKNILVVGAASDAVRAGASSPLPGVLSFSSSGPTADGRLKPEIIANGDTLISCDNTPVTGNIYTVLSGTSMAAAVVSGGSAIFIERYQQRYGPGTFPAPQYLRAAYAQTATDLGRAGPDYLHGFGMFDLSSAVALLDADAGTGKRIAFSAIDALTPERFFVLNSDGVQSIKATLCWNDEAGDVLAAKALVNDLDLRLTRASDQSVTFPFILDPKAQDQPARQGINSVDTIEQVLLGTPVAGRYLLAVRGTALLSSTNFALASSHALTEDLAPIPVIHADPTSGPPPLAVSFDGSASSDPDGSIAFYRWDFGDGNSAQGVSANHIYAAGIFTATLKVVDNLGATAFTTVKIVVGDKPPIPSVSASPLNAPAPSNVMFSAAGSIDPDGSIAGYQWDFGDGTQGTGLNVAHVYAAAGLYSAVLTVVDNAGLSSSKAVEIFAGTPFSPSAGGFTLDFSKTGHDSFTISTRLLALDPGTLVAGKSGDLQIGASHFPFTLDSKGNFRSKSLNVGFGSNNTKLSVRLSNADLQTALKSTGAVDGDIPTSTVLVPFCLTLEGGPACGAPAVPFIYSGKAGKRGTGRLFKL